MDTHKSRILMSFAVEVRKNATLDEDWFVNRTAMRLWHLLDNRVPENECNQSLMKQIHGQALQLAQKPRDEDDQQTLLLSLEQLASRCNDRRVSPAFLVREITQAIQPVDTNIRLLRQEP